LIQQAEANDCSALSLERVPWERVPSYGVASVADHNTDGASFSVQDLVEKPTQDRAPSNLAITGRYVLKPEIFDHLRNTEIGVGDELQLTDALRNLSKLRGVELRGERYDIGNIPDWLQANIEMAIEHDDGEMYEAVSEIFKEYTDE
jgi:UTP--glucose-1-phosphate uridylyltransferase